MSAARALKARDSNSVMVAIKAKTLFPLDYRSREMLATLLLSSPDVPPDIALAEADSLLDTDNSPPVLMQKALYLAQIGRNEEARKALDEFEKLSPKDSQMVSELIEAIKRKIE